MKNIHYRKKHMTLLETLVAFSLLAMLLFFVFGFFREISEISRMTEHSQKESFQMRYVETRLNYLFERIVNENLSAKTFFFYTESPNHAFTSMPSLILSFDNGVRQDPAFSGQVLARIYVDLKQRLCLAIWPLHVKDPYQFLQEEILLENVDEINFHFYSAPEKVKSATDIVSPKDIDPQKKSPERNHWVDNGEWFITYKEMPSIVKLILTQKNKENKEVKHTFRFVLPSSKNYVYYPPGNL